jgi:hypothetical protein
MDIRPSSKLMLDCLNASLELDLAAEVAWDALADQREHELASGAVSAMPLEAAVARLEARFSGCK